MHFTSLGTIACIVPLLITQIRAEAGSPRFEVASVKPSALTEGLRGGCRGIDSRYAPSQEAAAPPLGRCVITNARLSHLILIAWRLSDIQLLKSKPTWIARGSDRFAIEAKAEDPRTATEEQLLKMLQTLIIERFQLKFHREKVERAGFALKVGKKGFKPKHAAEETARRAGEGGKPLPGQPVTINAREYSMTKLAAILSGYGPGPVVDQTGLTDFYSFRLSWDETAGPSLFSALQDQLGLRLEPRKVPVEYFIVDSAEKPSEN
jgi:uncharacterized protein (TIGR03435 family)